MTISPQPAILFHYFCYYMNWIKIINILIHKMRNYEIQIFVYSCPYAVHYYDRL
jgi:hypothetical protein